MSGLESSGDNGLSITRTVSSNVQRHGGLNSVRVGEFAWDSGGDRLGEWSDKSE